MLLLFALVALLGVATASPALATASEVKLVVNENCVELDWPCWATPGSSQPALKVMVAEGGSVAFTDHGKATNIAWTGAAPTTCDPSVPIAPTAAETGWEGKCTFATPETTYNFESATLFKEPGLDYTKYEIVVGGPPKAKTTLAGAVNQTEATFNGSVSPEGDPVEYHFEYEDPGVTGKQSTASTPLNAPDFVSHSVSQTVSGLRPGSTYNVELVVTYAGSEALGGPEAVTTPAPTAPTATTASPSGLNETKATLNGKVNPQGGEEAKYWFEWGVGSSASYEHSTPEIGLPADGAQHAASSVLLDLEPGTEYHFRVVAQNKIGGPIMGSDLKFTTASPPPAKEPEPPSEPTPPGSTPAPTQPIIASALPKAEEKLAILTSPLVAGSLKLSVPRHGSTVHVSLDVAQAGAGGKLEVDLLAKAASLAKGARSASASTRVGGLVRASISNGKVSFSVGVNARAKSALRRHRKLALTVRITLTPPAGAPDVVTGNVVLHA